MISFGSDRILFDFGPHDSHVNDVWCPSVARLVMMMQRLRKSASGLNQKMIENVSHRLLLLESPR